MFRSYNPWLRIALISTEDVIKVFNKRPKHDQPREDCRYFVMNEDGSRVIWIANYNADTGRFVSRYDTALPRIHSNVKLSVLEPGQRDPVMVNPKAQAYQMMIAQLR